MSPNSSSLGRQGKAFGTGSSTDGQVHLTNEESHPDQILSLQERSPREIAFRTKSHSMLCPPFQHILQVGQPRFTWGDDMDSIGAEGAVDKPLGMQVSQGVRYLEQQVHDHLHVQHWELGSLQARDKMPRKKKKDWGPDTVAFCDFQSFHMILTATKDPHFRDGEPKAQ